MNSHQDLMLYNQKVYTKTTISSFEKSMDRYNSVSINLTEYILKNTYGEEYWFNYILPYFIDYRFILPESLDVKLDKPFFSYKFKYGSPKKAYFEGYPIDVLMRKGPQRPVGFLGKWDGLKHLRNNDVEPVVDQLSSFFNNYGYSVYYVVTDERIEWYVK